VTAYKHAAVDCTESLLIRSREAFPAYHHYSQQTRCRRWNKSRNIEFMPTCSAELHSIQASPLSALWSIAPALNECVLSPLLAVWND